MWFALPDVSRPAASSKEKRASSPLGTASAESTFFPFSMHTGPAEATSQTAGAAFVVFAPSEITSDRR